MVDGACTTDVVAEVLAGVAVTVETEVAVTDATELITPTASIGLLELGEAEGGATFAVLTGVELPEPLPLGGCTCSGAVCCGEGAGVLLLLPEPPASPANDPRRDGDGFFLSIGWLVFVGVLVELGVLFPDTELDV